MNFNAIFKTIQKSKIGPLEAKLQRICGFLFWAFHKVYGIVSFPHEAIRGSDFFSAQVDAFPYHEWPKATSDSEMHQRVLIKSQTRELPHVEKAFSNVAINKLVNLKIP